MLSLFIGSSSEAQQRKILSFLVTRLHGVFDVIPWYRAFDQGVFTLEAILNWVNKVDLALLVFTKDDERESRGRKDHVSRDNVILEYGLFLARLGRERVCILQEEGVSLPTDLLGLTVLRFKSNSSEHDLDVTTEAELDLRIDNIERKWRELPPLNRQSHPLDDSELGVAATIQLGKSFLTKIESALETLAQNDEAKFRHPIYFDASQLCISTYAEALKKVKRQFWTTTYLSSGFWTKGDAQILNANRKMLEHLRSQNGDVRRLFLLRQPHLSEIESWKQMLIHFRRQDRDFEVKQLEFEFHNLQREISILLKEGCKVKVIFDELAHQKLSKQIRFTYGDSELAIYDDFRVDIFGGGKSGRIADVAIYSKVTQYFETILESAETYFKALWREADSIESFLSHWEEVYFSALKQIDYAHSNWLSQYDFHLRPEDEQLKQVEIQSVKDILEEMDKWGNISRYLDIGTCTARYPLEFRDAVIAEGEIIGIDNDRECVKLARVKSIVDSRIRILDIDFSEKEIQQIGQFDLITCMLGTISHFGWDKNSTYTDTLQRVLERISTLLAQDGILILSVWSEHACKNLQMIDIYRKSDRQRLAEWTPTVTELKNRLELLTISTLLEIMVDARLNILICKRKNSPVTQSHNSFNPTAQ
jgi:SAM-dependent methyltransferase